MSNQKEQLAKLNDYLQQLMLKQRWRTLDEVNVYEKRNWKRIISSRELITIVVHVLIAITKLEIFPFLNTKEGVFAVCGAFAIVSAKDFLVEVINKPPLKQLIMNFFKEIMIQSIVLIGVAGKTFDLDVPEQVVNLFSPIVFGILLFQMNVISQLKLEYELALKIYIEGKDRNTGKDWVVSRLQMMSPEGQELLTYFKEIKNDEQSQNSKKNE